MTYLNQKQSGDNRLQLALYLIVYLFVWFVIDLFIFKTAGIKKTCLKRFHSNVASDMIWKCSTLWK